MSTSALWALVLVSWLGVLLQKSCIVLAISVVLSRSPLNKVALRWLVCWVIVLLVGASKGAYSS